MKNKKLIILLIGIILLITCVIFEYLPVGGASTNTYYVKVKRDGQNVKFNHFKGYKYTETVYDAQGKEKHLSFYSTEKLTKNAQFKIVINNTQLVSQFKKVAHFPKQIKHYAKKEASL